MAYRAAATGQGTALPGATDPPRPATPPPAAAWAATSWPWSGPLPVWCLARPATDMSVTVPDAAQHTHIVTPPATMTAGLSSPSPAGFCHRRGPQCVIGPLTLPLGRGSGWAGGSSILPTHSVTGTRNRLDRFR
ncbi:hypothetical protein GCM10023170_050400 [Phytohabitans houttuyneae]|uniref:Uncharacterized protein n=1 Tax=Phytohabitans houttuyneae TaxID=1076126 RepID=A0A6V8KTE2_9ACTN|nr:hypothetical protein Phou_093060 [Phytohabitans houttuyneae]